MPVISKTHIGLVRKNNEDSLLVREPHLFAIADGMGGYAAGEVASKEALKVLDKLIEEAIGGRWSAVYKQPVYLNIFRDQMNKVRAQIAK